MGLGRVMLIRENPRDPRFLRLHTPKRLQTSQPASWKTPSRREPPLDLVRLILQETDSIREEGTTMHRATVWLAVSACCVIGSPALADYGVQDKGTWPAAWPQELEPLRGQSRTLEGPLILLL